MARFQIQRIHKTIYEIRQSGKGWSESFEFYFYKERAERRLKELLEWKKEHNYKFNFKLFEVTCADSIAYWEEK